MSASSSWINDIVCNCCYFFLIILSAFYPLTPTAAQPPLPPLPPPPPPTTTANPSTTWTLDYDYNHNSYYESEITIEKVSGIFKFILPTDLEFRDNVTTRSALGFFCPLENGSCTSYFFSILIFSEEGTPSPLVWSANRDYPVNNNAILNFTSAGELVLRDTNGRMVWTTNSAGKSVIGMNLTDTGNLVLYDVNNQVVWQSFDHPTDCLLPGQRLYQGQKLIPSVSSTNWTSQKGMYSLQVTDEGLFAYVESNPPQAYFSKLVTDKNASIEKGYVRFLNGNLSLFIHSDEPSHPDGVISIPRASSAQFIKLMPDGHLKVFEWQAGWTEVADVFSHSLEDCDYPLACGRNGVCSDNQQCHCPISRSSRIEYFRALDDLQPNLGCSELTPLTCNAIQHQVFIELENVDYFAYSVNMHNVDMETCKQACLNNCSCKAALFRYGSDSSDGYCYLPSDLFTMMYADPNLIHYNTSAFVKVQNVRPKSRVTTIFITSIAGSFLLLLVVVGFIILINRKRRWDTKLEEEYINEVPGMPTRFSYGELKAATENFSKKLGEGGFGTVFEGILEDGSKIAVKCLEGLGQVNKSFLAEVESIGSIHHVNLVRLRGYSAWKSRRLIVYDFMSNGSLDRWIYHGDLGNVLEWECRKNIILHIAKGLAYLHEECRQQIIHLDIKPQNILLDDNFNAKVSDFGLSKLVDKNQTQVMTTIKGTPGYIAPECWISSIITEKVDVYSFGIVVLEILCGRKIFDRSLPEESWYLLGVFQKSWEQGRLLDMVDKYSEDMQENGAEVVEMMKVASWCLQTEFTRRPSMSSVVKVLEGGMSVESNLDYNFTDYLRMQKTAVAQEKELTQLMPSIISGPR